mmetsp:Transcript_2570/g.6173  ORF Transcript_2570/g.6173 Transcript_2570/m.6173 type:complete len:655 (+) Transcript_2570:196-2160(+)
MSPSSATAEATTTASHHYSIHHVHSMSDLAMALTEDRTNIAANAKANSELLSFDDPVLRAMRLREVAISSTTDGDNNTNSNTDNNNISQQLLHAPAETTPFASKDWVLHTNDDGNNNNNNTLPQTLDKEMRRLLVLRSYLLLDTKEDSEAMGFDAITRLASRMLDCPIALVSLTDMDRQWFLSEFGLGSAATTTTTKNKDGSATTKKKTIHRKHAFCTHAMLSPQEDVMVVPDATADTRFQNNPSVTGSPHVRFYAGAPLVSPEGYKLGTLCVLGKEARPEGLCLEEKQNLRDLADMAVEAMARRRKEKIRAHFHNPKQTIAQMAHELLTPLQGVQRNLSTLSKDSTLLKEMSPDEQELLQNALYCSDAVSKICDTAIEELRQQQNALDLQNSQKRSSFLKQSSFARPNSVKTANLVHAWYIILETFPKNVPVSITMDPSVPKDICVDELKVFRSALNYLSNACQRTLKGSIQLVVKMVTTNNATNSSEDKDTTESSETKTMEEEKSLSETKTNADAVDADATTTTQKPQKWLFVECTDTAPDIPVENYPLLFHPSEYYEEQLECIRPTANGGCEPICRMQTHGLGLYSVAVQIGSITGGEYGFKPRMGSGGDEHKTIDDDDNDNDNGERTKNITQVGSIFWFKVPMYEQQGGL